MQNAYDMLKKPRITEKGSRSTGVRSKVVFEVPTRANKTEIKKAVQLVFNVEVASVHTAIARGKVKRRGRSIGRRPNWKKAIITLKEGFEIDLFGGATA